MKTMEEIVPLEAVTDVVQPAQDRGDAEKTGEAFQNTILPNLDEEETVDSEEDVAVYCKPCDRDNLRLQATGFCIDCDEHLCDDCVNYHKKAKPSKNHVILNQESMPKSRRGSKYPGNGVPMEDITCPTHKEKPVEFYCHSHATTLCYVCSTLDHAKCKIDFIPDISKEFTKSPEFMSRAEKVEMLVSKTVTMAKVAQKLEEENEEEIKATLKDIDAFRGEINETLQLWERQIKQIAEEQKSSQTEKIKSIENACAEFQKTASTLKASTLKASFENSKSQTNCNRRFIELMLADQKMEEYEAEIVSQKECAQLANVKFVPNEKVAEVFRCETALGSISRGEDELPPCTVDAAEADPRLPTETMGGVSRCGSVRSIGSIGSTKRSFSFKNLKQQFWQKRDA